MVAEGMILLDESWKPAPPGAALSFPAHNDEFVDTNIPSPSTAYVPAGTGVRLPFWLLTALAATTSTVPWIPRRFSLRTLLIATTLVAVALGVILAAT